MKAPLNIFQHIEMPLVPVLSRVERNGVKIDPPCCMRTRRKLPSARLSWSSGHMRSPGSV
ncbi:hypothetical protein FZ929_16170 [Klebsiella pneumoniae]|uniref:Uncharacterized protein n=1 Tax=Klebsiella pneumoniae TaxID=573 RepID=A0A5C2LHM8_KLEPN|nr:hypothetical protein FZ929_16170 [Klebsiella pneumoniae]